MVVAVSSEVKADLLAHGCRADRIRVLLNGIDHRRFRRDPALVPEARRRCGLSDGQIAIGTAGRLEPQKRFDLLIAAFAALRQSHPTAQLLIAGHGSLQQALQAQIDARNLGSSCRLLGHVEDVSAFHHALDLFVQSSTYEGTPNAVLEAMALETPVVATDVGGTSELLTHGRDGLLVPPGDADALASAMQQALCDRGTTRSRVAAARHRVETDLSFDGRLRALEAIYRELAGARRHQ
jgi:glycosyltransferase involved in cell wall biosynthesis